MPAVEKVREPQILTHAQPVTALDERAWRAWLTKGRLQAERAARVRLEAVKAVSILGLLAAAVLWPSVAPYEIALRFGIAAASLWVMFQAFRSGHHTLGAMFGVVALLYNPIMALFSASGDLQRVLLTIALVPFILSLGWRNVRKPR